MRDQQKSATTAQRKAERRSASLRPVSVHDTRPLATYAIIGITAFVYLLQQIPGLPITSLLAFNSVFVWPGAPFGFQPWRLLTVLVVHGSFLHVGLNMLVVWMIGRNLEPLLGRWRYVVLYLLSGLGGSVAVALLAPGVNVVGASGAIFGLFGALLVIGRHIGANIRGIVIVIAINFAFPFALALIASIGSGSFATALDAIRISWQAHLGGLVTGAAVGYIYARTRAVRRRRLQTGLLVALGVVLLALLALPPVIYG
nr:rhomboid family intramembrane serine protease [Microbacterium ulmi]